jgi:DNA-binding transcriptional LysR family regulator
MRLETGDLEAFVDLSRSRSFTATAARLRIDRTVVSKRIQRLEGALGVRVLERTTRSVRLTEEGALLLHKAKEVFEGLAVIADLFSQPLAPKGTVRMSAPVTVSSSLLSRILPGIRKTYPDIRIELIATDRVLDFVAEGLDLTVRAGVPEDFSFVGRRLTANELVLAASPKYLKTFGTPSRVSDLKSHSLLFHDFHRGTVFKKTRIPLRDFETCRGVVCDDSRILNRLAEEGTGICIRPRWDLEESLSARRLMEIRLPDQLDDRTFLYLLYPKTALLPQRTKVVAGAIESFFKTRTRSALPKSL